MKPFEVFLDMDGVLCEFDGTYRMINGLSYKQRLTQEEFNANWENFIQKKGFYNLEFLTGAKELIAFVQTLKDSKIEILSSLGGEKNALEVESQKRQWLENRGIWIKRNFVVNKSEKKNYCNQKFAVLIDDDQNNIEDWKKAGGIGILHVDDMETTINMLNVYYLHYLTIRDGGDYEI